MLGKFDTSTTNVMVAQANDWRPPTGQLDLDPCSPANRAELSHLGELHRAIQDAALKAEENECKVVDENKNANDSVSSSSFHVLPAPGQPSLS